MDFDVETLQKQIPVYLTEGDKKQLIAQLNDFADGNSPDYFVTNNFKRFEDEMLQGDGWQGFELIEFESGKRRPVRGVVLSNSCDVDTANHRDIPTRVTFAPLVKLSAYKKVLEKSDIKSDRIEAKLSSIRAQQPTSMFYFPGAGPLTEEYLIRFDDIYSMPIKKLSGHKKIFTLSMAGFYLFILKLSLHFCRLQENVMRNAE